MTSKFQERAWHDEARWQIYAWLKTPGSFLYNPGRPFFWNEQSNVGVEVDYCPCVTVEYERTAISDSDDEFRCECSNCSPYAL